MKGIYKRYNFDKFWKFFPVKRPFKETLKTVLFSSMPSLFSNWEIYQNWINSRVFVRTDLNACKLTYWERMLKKSYKIPLKENLSRSHQKENPYRLAVVIHVFYPEIFKEILEKLKNQQNVQLSLYITGTREVWSEVKPWLHGLFTEIYFLEVQNRGRDILPFLKVLPKVFEDGHEIILKLHTKGSNHLNRREHWRNQLFSSLIGKGSIEKALHIFHSNPAIGMIGSAGNILPMYLYYSSNGAMVHNICRKMGVNDARLQDMNFVAGSMFYARQEALLPVLKLNLSAEDFEPEAGQTDGTIAHAVERAFAGGVIASGLQLADTGYSVEKPVLRVNKVNKHIV